MGAELKKWIRKCDDLFRELIRLRDDYTCQLTEIQKPKEYMEVSHYVRRGNKMLRWDPNNACLVTSTFHRQVPEHQLRKWYRGKFPVRAAVCDRLKRMTNDLDPKKLEARYEEMKKEILEVVCERQESNITARRRQERAAEIAFGAQTQEG